MNKHCVYRKS